MYKLGVSFSVVQMTDPDIIGGFLHEVFGLLANNIEACECVSVLRGDDISACKDSEEIIDGIGEIFNISNKDDIYVETKENPLFHPTSRDDFFQILTENDTGSYIITDIDFTSKISKNDANVVRSQKYTFDCDTISGTVCTSVFIDDDAVQMKSFGDYVKHFVGKETMYVIQ